MPRFVFQDVANAGSADLAASHCLPFSADSFGRSVCAGIPAARVTRVERIFCLPDLRRGQALPPRPQLNGEAIVKSEKIETPQTEFAPKPLSTRQNVVLTVKVLVGAGVVIGLLWVANAVAMR